MLAARRHPLRSCTFVRHSALALTGRASAKIEVGAWKQTAMQDDFLPLVRFRVPGSVLAVYTVSWSTRRRCRAIPVVDVPPFFHDASYRVPAALTSRTACLSPFSELCILRRMTLLSGSVGM